MDQRPLYMTLLLLIFIISLPCFMQFSGLPLRFLVISLRNPLRYAGLERGRKEKEGDEEEKEEVEMEEGRRRKKRKTMAPSLMSCSWSSISATRSDTLASKRGRFDEKSRRRKTRRRKKKKIQRG